MNNPQDIHIIGAGYVGLTLGAFFLKHTRNRVIFYDENSDLIENLKNNVVHVYEPELQEILAYSYLDNRVSYLSQLKSNTSSLMFICISTPRDSEANPVVKFMERNYSSLTHDAKVFIRSTVKVGTASKVFEFIREKSLTQVEVYSAPERTAEGVAIKEIETLPQLLGINSEVQISKSTLDILRSLNFHEIKLGFWEEVELAKLLCNVWRDYTFAFANIVNYFALENHLDAIKTFSLANSGYGRSAIPRPGPVGGPCLSKDTYLLGQDNDQILDLLFRARKANEKYEEYLTNSIVDIVKSKKKDKVIVAGVAFKGEPKTNDDRNSFGKSLLIRLDQLKISKVLKYWDPLVDIGLCPRIESMDMLKDELANAILIITNNNEEISSFLNSLPRDYWTEIDNLLIIDIGGRLSLAKDSCELIHLGNLKQ